MSTFTDTIQSKPARNPAARVSPHHRLLNDAACWRRSSPIGRDRGGDGEDKRSVSLLDQAHRRVKSNMQATIALLRLGRDEIEQPSTEAVLTEMENRLQSMASLQRALCRSGNLDQIDLAVCLRQSASLRNSQPSSPLLGGWVLESSESLAWSRDEDGMAAAPAVQFMGLDGALSLAPSPWTNLAQRAVYACAIVFPPSIFRWRSPQTGPSGRGRLAKPGDVGVRLRTGHDGVVVELSLSDCGPGLPAFFDAKRQRMLGMELASVLARLVQGSVNGAPDSEPVFEVSFVPSYREAAQSAFQAENARAA